MYANENLRKWRLVRGYKQYYMGEQVNITAQAYGKIERAESQLTKEAAIKFALALDIPLEEIYIGEGSVAKEKTLTPKEAELYEKLMQEKDERIKDKDKVIALQEIIIQEREKKKKR